MAELGKAYVQIVPSAQGIAGSITNALSGESSKAGETAGNTIMGKIKSIALKAGVGAVIANGIKASLSEGAAFEQALGGVQTLFGVAQDKMINYANQAYLKCGISARQYMEQSTSFAAALVSSCGGNVNKAADMANMAMESMADNSAKMGTNIVDLQNAYQGFAKQNYTINLMSA